MPKIAIIDDDPDIVEATKIVLDSKGYETVSAGNVTEGLALIDSEKPDLIVLDVMMEEPDDGFYMANKLRKKGVGTPIIMLTSVSKVIGFEYGKSDVVPINEFLEKPVQTTKLLEIIEKLLN